MSKTSIFTDRETAAILAGLRLYQENHRRFSDDLFEIASCCGDFEPLNVDEVDVLCERINCGGPELRLLDFICDELAGLAMNHIIDGVVLGKDEIIFEVRGWKEPYTIPLATQQEPEFEGVPGGYLPVTEGRYPVPDLEGWEEDTYGSDE